MKILVEGHKYEHSLIQEICGNFDIVKDGKISQIGYFFNPSIKDCVICLPKVIKDESRNTVLGGLCAEDLIDAFSPTSENSLNDIQKRFVKDFALWSYRTIAMFRQLNPKSNIINSSSSSKDSSAENDTHGTLLDVILSIIAFYKSNKDYFIYIIKNLHIGCNRINWRKTIAGKVPVIHNGVPAYLNVINRKKQINFDEELMIIFYSIINYISDSLGITIITECNYDIITGPQFESYMEGLGLARLNAIKYKYFSDKDLYLWKLCHSFFEKILKIQSSDYTYDFLMINNFDIVFENMIDTIIGDQNLPGILKNQEDGKIVDHIFKYKSPIDGKMIYYIGDSKYYSIGAKIGDQSVYKQFTYAKNVIQYHFINETKKKLEDTEYRDNLTEGYNFTPNFFLSAYIPNTLNFDSAELDCTKHKPLRIYHFENRLFDRDTLWLTHFEINLLFVMKLYAENDSISQNSFKSILKTKVLEAFHIILREKYNFFKIKPFLCNDKEFISTHFMLLNGKIYTYSDGEILLALEKDSSDSHINYSKVKNCQPSTGICKEFMKFRKLSPWDCTKLKIQWIVVF